MKETIWYIGDRVQTLDGHTGVIIEIYKNGNVEVRLDTQCMDSDTLTRIHD